MGDAGTLGNGMRCDRNRRDRQLSTARTAAVKVIPRFVTVPTAICAPIPKTAQRLYRGLAQVTNWGKLEFSAMNLKKPATWLWMEKLDPFVLILLWPIYARNPVYARRVDRISRQAEASALLADAFWAPQPTLIPMRRATSSIPCPSGTRRLFPATSFSRFSPTWLLFMATVIP